MNRISLVIFALIFTSLALLDQSYNQQQLYTNIRDGFANMLEITSNAYFNWKFDSLVLFLKSFKFLNQIDISTFYYLEFACSLIIFLLHLKKPIIESLSLVLISTSIFYVLLGNNILAIGVLANIPLSILMLSLFRNFSNFSKFLIGIFIAIRFTETASSLAWIPLIILISILLITNLELYKNAKIALIAAFCSCCLLICSIPDPHNIDYPNNAHLVPDDGIPGILAPLVSNSFALKVINHAALAKSYLPLTIFILICLTIDFLRLRNKNILILITASLLVLLHYLTSAPIYHILPIASLERLIPGNFYFDISLYILTAVIFISLMQIILDSDYKKLLIFSLLVLGFNKFFPLKTIELNQVFTSANQINEIYISPSFYVLQETKLNPERITKFQGRHYQHISKFPVLVSANSDLNLANLSDHKPETRWSSGLGKQTATEYINLEFKDSINIAGIKLATGDFINDFPRGIKISGADKCTDQLKELIKIPDWQGVVKTTDKGYPYFYNQGNVKILLPQDFKGRCIKIEQISKTPNFDWSVTEIEILTNESN